MRRMWTIGLLVIVVLLAAQVGAPVLAQEDTPTRDTPQALTLFTRYPAQEVAIGENVTFDLTLQAGEAQTVRLAVQDLPEGWTATFRGGGKVILAAHIEPEKDASVSLRVELPPNVQADTYRFSVVARGEGEQAQLPIELVVKEKAPPSLEFDVDLPTLRGGPKTTFRYNVTLKNKGDEDLSVNLVAEAPPEFQITFKLSGQDVTSIPITANESKRLSVEAKAYTEVAAGAYEINVLAQGGETQATTRLVAEVVGRPDLTITSQSGRLSGKAYAGKEMPFTIIVRNAGSAPAYNVQLSASQPSGWSVGYDQETIAVIEAGEEVQVTANVQPAEKAVAGDYMVTFRARSEGGTSESVEFRITVLTSTLWGIVGVGLIAVAVVVVGLTVMRFGRR